jgi:hypothetical protein
MTNEPINLFDVRYDKLLEQERERLRTYYGDRVENFDLDQIDTLSVFLDIYIDRFGEPRNPVYFLKYVEDETRLQKKFIELMRQRDE